MIESIETPIGRVFFAAHDGALVALGFEEQWPALLAKVTRRFGVMNEARGASDARSRIARYFSGDLDAIAELAIDAEGTPFQTRVWSALRAIPKGETRSYSDLAAIVGSKNAVRAVGTANGQNPIAIVVPCHRVIAKRGALAGYAGGVARKEWLLSHEARFTRRAPPTFAQAKRTRTAFDRAASSI